MVSRRRISPRPAKAMPAYGAVPVGPTLVPSYVARNMGIFDLELHPELWRTPTIEPFYRTRTWTRVTFATPPPITVPNDPGIYMFVVAPRCANLADHSYIFYVGQATNLRQRYRQYLLEKQGRGASPRDKVMRFLNHFDGFDPPGTKREFGHGWTSCANARQPLSRSTTWDADSFVSDFSTWTALDTKTPFWPEKRGELRGEICSSFCAASGASISIPAASGSNVVSV